MEVDGAVLTVTIDRPQARNAVDPETAHALEEAFQRFGVPLIDLGTVRLPRLIGQGRALDLILTGRGVEADEALRIASSNAWSSLATRWRRRNGWHASSRPFLKARCAPIGRARSTSGRSVLRTRCAPSSEAERRW